MGGSVDIKDIFPPAQTFGTLGSFINVLSKNAFTIAGIITLILLIFGGFQYIVSAGSGDAKQLEKGKKTVTSAIAGLLLIVGSFWIVQIIQIITGAQILPK